MTRHLLASILATTWLAGACVAPAPPAQDTSARAPGEAQSRTLVAAVRYEANDLAAKTAAGAPASFTKRLFNAALVLVDGSGATQPYLAEALPQLQTPSWQVLPDGRMETTYKLRPGLTWHDDRPLTGADFAFAFRMYTTPGLGLFTSRPQDQMESVTAADPQTVVVRWRSLYPEAGTLRDGDLAPLPAHLLEDPLGNAGRDAAAMDALRSHPYWTVEFVGAGPFRLARWEPGVEIEAAAFAGHALGRPKIDRIIVRVFSDENTVLSNLLSRTVQFATNFTLRLEHTQSLRQEWGPTGGGTILLWPGARHFIVVQFRPELLKVPALGDLRVRKALAHTVDREALNDATYSGEGFMNELFVPRDAPYFAEVDRVVPKYRYDPRQAGQLMNEAGFTRDRDGFFITASGERFAPDYWLWGGPQWERTLTTLTDTWRRAGIDVQPSVLPAAQVRDNEARSAWPALGTNATGASERQLETFTTPQIGTAANRWAGNNKGGWSSPEFDRLWEGFTTTLDRSERNRQIAEMAKLLNEQLPVIQLFSDIQVSAHLSVVRGPAVNNAEGQDHWNVHEWEMG